MSFLHMYRSQAARLPAAIADLQKEKGKHAQHRARAMQRASDAQRSRSSTKSLSTIQSKSGEIERHNRDAAREDDRIADIEKKIAQKYVDLNREQEKVSREEQRELEQQQRAQKRLADESQKRMREQEAAAKQMADASDRQF